MSNLLSANSIFLTGVPATGKSYFGHWLEQNKGFYHLDFDEEDIVRRRGLAREQELVFRDQTSAPLHQALLAIKQPIVLNWGFAPQKMLPLVKETLALGFKPVWFSAERFVARQAFIERGGIDVRYFDQYLKLITDAEADLMAVFGACVIKTLRDDAIRMKPEDNYACIFPGSNSGCLERIAGF